MCFVTQNDVDGRAYYTFEFTAQAPNYTRHALGAIVIANGITIHLRSFISMRSLLVLVDTPCVSNCRSF
jgi:hypothetical protein